MHAGISDSGMSKGKTARFIVHVCHEEQTPTADEIACLLGIGAQEGADIGIVAINTAGSCTIGENVIGPDALNRYFEFSGYAYGMAKVLLENSFDHASVIFTNSTISNGLPALYRAMLYRLLREVHDTRGKPRISGLVQHLEEYDIIPSCFFELCGHRDDLARFVFAAPPFRSVFRSVVQGDFDRLPLHVGEKERFETAIRQWLLPSGFARGWYMAPWFQELDKATYRRKRITIFLEHSLLGNNPDFWPNDLGRFAGIRILSTMNRFVLNVKKIAFRLRHLLHKGIPPA